MVKQLAFLGYQAICVPCGGKAVDEALGNAIDLILMDVRMPNVDGLEATRRIRQAEDKMNRVHIPIIAVSAEAPKEVCLSAGMNDFAEKPLKLEKLKTLISKWIK